MYLKKLIIYFFLLVIPTLCFSKCTQYDPWYTGPFLAVGANNTDKGTTNPSVDLYYIVNHASYDSSWHKSNVTDTKILIPDFSIAYGMTSWLDITFDAQINSAKNDNYSSAHWRDISVKLGFQLLKDKKSTYIPSIRFILEESFPTGKYQNLKRVKDYIDATGTGGYNTTIGLCMSKTFELFKCHPIQLLSNILYTIPSNVNVSSANIYTGLLPANGKVFPGKIFVASFSFDFSFTQRFAFSMDTIFTYISKTRFKGTRVIESISIVPLTPANTSLATTSPPALVISQVDSRSALLTLSPALEYNFTSDLGIIITYWTSIIGKNQSAFRSIAGSISYTF